MYKEIHLIGFGSQAEAWSQNLKDRGWRVFIYLRSSKSPSALKAQELGFNVDSLQTLHNRLRDHPPHAPSALVSFLCSDLAIGQVYQEYLSSIPAALTLVLAHGYAVFSGDLKPQNPAHTVALLAPKAIGPQLRKNFVEADTQGQKSHDLVAAFSNPQNHKTLSQCAEDLGFTPDNLVVTTPEIEARGDLISEQGLICGGLFTLMSWTMEAMLKAGIPPRLIQEECVTELMLVVGLIKERGLEATLRAISQAALCGTVKMTERFEESNMRALFQKQLSTILEGSFINEMRSEGWKAPAEKLAQRLRVLDDALQERKPLP